MNAQLVKKSKWFWAWQDDREEAWLEEMDRQGLHLKTPNVGRYTFEKGEPRQMVYRLDFIAEMKKDDYLQLFKDAGWEHVSELLGWQYWRKPAGADQTAEIFTDTQSKVQKYQRLLNYLLLTLPLYLLPVIISLDHPSTHPHSPFSGIVETFLIIMLPLLFIFIATCMALIWRRMGHLRRKLS